MSEQATLEIMPNQQECEELVKLCRKYFDPWADCDLEPGMDAFHEKNRRQVERMDRICELVGLR